MSSDKAPSGKAKTAEFGSFPGLKVRKNHDGTFRIYWCARADLVRIGYTPKTVRLFHDLTTEAGRLLIKQQCEHFQAEMLAWASGQKQDYSRFDGTLASLIRLYQHDDASPYRDIKWNTRKTYEHTLTVIEKAFGQRSLAVLKIADFRRWYDEAKKPKTEGGPERVNKAHKIVAMLRRLFSYGVMTELPECQRLSTILGEARFKQPGRRTITLDLEHVEAFIDKALEMGRTRVALGTALQFETGMRQRDVIGEWRPLADNETPAGIMFKHFRWCNGLTWADLSNNLVVRKQTTKTGAMVAADLKLTPLVSKVLAHIPATDRVGPVVIDENAGRPFVNQRYAQVWRKIAKAAGVPMFIKNMDARAGAITEAEDAGAELDTIRGAIGHKTTATTARYSRGAVGKSRTVAKMRVALRKHENED